MGDNAKFLLVIAAVCAFGLFIYLPLAILQEILEFASERLRRWLYPNLYKPPLSEKRAH